MLEQLNYVVNLVAPVAQALELAKLEIKCKWEENKRMTGGEC